MHCSGGATAGETPVGIGYCLVLQTADLDLANDSLVDGGLLVEFRRKFRIMEKVLRHPTKSAEQGLDACQIIRYSKKKRGGVRVSVVHATNDSCGGTTAGG